MQTDRRLTILESNLQVKERTLAWLKKAQALGGFFDHCRAATAPFLIEDGEAAFLFHLVNQCNGQVLEMTVSPALRLFALYLLRLVLTDTVKAHEAELSGLHPLLLSFVAQGLALDAAIQSVCKNHVGGNQVLFSDVQQTLCGLNQKREQLLDLYNAIAPKLGFEPIHASDLRSTVSAETSRKVDELIRLSRAQAAADFGCRYEARELLLPLIEPSTDNERNSSA